MVIELIPSAKALFLAHQHDTCLLKFDYTDVRAMEMDFRHYLLREVYISLTQATEDKPLLNLFNRLWSISHTSPYTRFLKIYVQMTNDVNNNLCQQFGAFNSLSAVH